MARLAEFERYMKYLCEALGHRDRHGGLVRQVVTAVGTGCMAAMDVERFLESQEV